LVTVMDHVDKMLSNKDVLGAGLPTFLEVNTMAIEHLQGKTWRIWENIFNELGPLAEDSKYNADLYVFLTTEHSGSGLANRGSLCSPDIKERISISGYRAHSETYNGKTYNTEFLTAQTVVHEMGHNLGMQHDCARKTGTECGGPEILDGRECYGYMGQQNNGRINKDWEGRWSRCSVRDFTYHVNSLQSMCLDKPCRTNLIDKTATNSCKYWKSLGLCLEGKIDVAMGRFNGYMDNPFENYVKENCAKTCGSCSSGKKASTTVSCGNHFAATCSKCTDPPAPSNNKRSWCNGECRWSSPCGMCVPKGVSDKPVLCGGHRACSCSKCIDNAPANNKPSWCNGKCKWVGSTSNGSCQPRPYF